MEYCKIFWPSDVLKKRQKKYKLGLVEIKWNYFLSNTNIDATGLKPRFELDLNYPQRLDSNYPLDYPDSNCTRTQSKEFLDIQATIECICVYSLWNAYVTWQEYTDKYRFWTFFLHDLKWKKNNKKLQSGSDFPLVKFLTLY